MKTSKPADGTLNASQLAALATGRDRSLFSADCEHMRPRIAAALRGARVLVIGGAGTIGASTVRLLAGYDAVALHVVDHNENNLVEVVRHLRASGRPLHCRDLRLLPLDFGSLIMRRFLIEQAGYDFILNFAAVKHVRSEKDVYSALHMLDTNVAKQAQLLQWLEDGNARARYFSVSTDKASNPVNLMGASKRLMEHVIFSRAFDSGQRSTGSARFANVAFSDGSLLQGWQMRLAQRQPLAVPSDTRRFFVSIEEAGEICLLAAIGFEEGQTAIPRLDAQSDLRPLEEVARSFLRAYGFVPATYIEATAALGDMDRELANGRYPLLITPLDTAGEKPFEEFVGRGEWICDVGLSGLQAVPYHGLASPHLITSLVATLREWITSAKPQVSKSAMVELVGSVIPEFAHADAAQKLDDRL